MDIWTELCVPQWRGWIAYLNGALADIASRHGEEAVFRTMELAQANVESNDGSDETESTSSIAQASYQCLVSELSCSEFGGTYDWPWWEDQ